MNLRIVSLCLLVAAGLLAGCEGRFEKMVGLATPTPEPTPVPRVAPSTPKPGSWMWDNKRRTLLDSTPRKR